MDGINTITVWEVRLLLYYRWNRWWYVKYAIADFSSAEYYKWVKSNQLMECKFTTGTTIAKLPLFGTNVSGIEPIKLLQVEQSFTIYRFGFIALLEW